MSKVACPQERVFRHTAGQIVEFAPVVSRIDVAVPQIGRALEILAVPEQVIVQIVPEPHVVFAEWTRGRGPC